MIVHAPLPDETVRIKKSDAEFPVLPKADTGALYLQLKITSGMLLTVALQNRVQSNPAQRRRRRDLPMLRLREVMPEKKETARI